MDISFSQNEKKNSICLKLAKNINTLSKYYKHIVNEGNSYTGQYPDKFLHAYFNP